MTGAELAKLCAEAVGAASGTVVAEWAAPPDQTALPAVVVAPGDPWVSYPRLGARPVYKWQLRLVVGRWDQHSTLETAADHYHAVVAALVPHAELVGIDPLSAPLAEDIGGQLYLVAVATVTTH